MREGRQRRRAGTLLHLGVRVQHLENALRRRDGLLQVRVDAAELLRRSVHQEHGREERGELSGRQAPRGNLAAPVPQRRRHADAADDLHQRRQTGQRRRDLHVRAEQLRPGRVELAGLVLFGAEGLHDAVAGKGFRAEVRQMREGFLAAPCRATNALAQPDKGIDDQRRTGEAHHRQPQVVVDHQGEETDQRQRLASQIADRFRHRLLNLPDIVVDPGHQLARRPMREEARGLPEDVPVQRVAHIHHHALAHVRHQVRRHVRADALQQVDDDDRPHGERQTLLIRQHVVEDRPDQPGQAGRAHRVDDHPGDGPHQPDAVGPRVSKQAVERIESGHESAGSAR